MHNAKEKQKEKVCLNLYTKKYIPGVAPKDHYRKLSHLDKLSALLFEVWYKIFLLKKISYQKETAKALLTKCITSQNTALIPNHILEPDFSYPITANFQLIPLNKCL